MLGLLTNKLIRLSEYILKLFPIYRQNKDLLCLPLIVAFLLYTIKSQQPHQWLRAFRLALMEARGVPPRQRHISFYGCSDSLDTILEDSKLDSIVQLIHPVHSMRLRTSYRKDPSLSLYFIKNPSIAKSRNVDLTTFLF